MAKQLRSGAFEYNNEIKIVAVMNMDNLTHTLVDYYDVGSFHATILKYIRFLALQLTCMVLQATIYYVIGCTLIGLQCSFANTVPARSYRNFAARS